MKVRLIKNCEGPNPAYNPKKPKDEVTNWPVIPKLKGTVIDHPDAHYLTYGEDPNAEPVDEEAKAKFEVYQKNREAGLAARALRAAEDGSDSTEA